MTPPRDRNEDELMSLDFTVPGAIAKLPQAASAVPEVPPAPAAAEQAGRVFEQAGKLKSDGQTEQACRMLETAVRAGADFGKDAECAWNLLLDLYQATGQREAFEARALEFATRFEKSPPAWAGTITAGTVAATGKIVSASLAGTLNARVEEPLKQVLKVCAKTPVRIDLTRITDADDRGCALLLAALDSCRKTQGQCLLAGAGRLADLLAGKTRSGSRDNQRIWLLLLELYQRLGREAAFDDAAVAYAVSFEVSPPSWEPARVGGCEN